MGLHSFQSSPKGTKLNAVLYCKNHRIFLVDNPEKLSDV